MAYPSMVNVVAPNTCPPVQLLVGACIVNETSESEYMRTTMDYAQSFRSNSFAKELNVFYNCYNDGILDKVPTTLIVLVWQPQLAGRQGRK